MTQARGGHKVAKSTGGQSTANGGRGGHVPAPAAEEAGQVPGSADDAVVRRTKDGWRVGGAELPDLTSAMVLADLLAAELASNDPPTLQLRAQNGDEPPGPGGLGRPGGPDLHGKEPAANESSKLRATIGQLEHALMARVRVEQAIGVLAERHRIQPRQAFEQLRSAARSRGRRVIDIATDVVASATNPLLQLPDELSRPRSAGRHARQARGVLGSD
jgi:hypothetical protein